MHAVSADEHGSHNAQRGAQRTTRGGDIISAETGAKGIGYLKMSQRISLYTISNTRETKEDAYHCRSGPLQSVGAAHS